jgi:hypothetical protein
MCLDRREERTGGKKEERGIGGGWLGGEIRKVHLREDSASPCLLLRAGKVSVSLGSGFICLSELAKGEDSKERREREGEKIKKRDGLVVQFRKSNSEKKVLLRAGKVSVSKSFYLSESAQGGTEKRGEKTAKGKEEGRRRREK